MAVDAGRVTLTARGVTAAPGIRGADVDLAEGDVLGVAGLLGSGRTELARAITGIDRIDSGVIRIEGAVMVKRVSAGEGRLVAESDNEAAVPVPDGEIEVVGRVVWRMGAPR